MIIIRNKKKGNHLINPPTTPNLRYHHQSKLNYFFIINIISFIIIDLKNLKFSFSFKMCYRYLCIVDYWRFGWVGLIGFREDFWKRLWRVLVTCFWIMILDWNGGVCILLPLLLVVVNCVGGSLIGRIKKKRKGYCLEGDLNVRIIKWLNFIEFGWLYWLYCRCCKIFLKLWRWY